MKQCPSCGTTYTDASLSYCLSDGATLTELSIAEEPTVVHPGRDPMRVEIPQTEPIVPQATVSQQASGGSSTVLKVVVVVLILIILAIIGLGIAGVIYYNSSRGDNPEVTNVNTNKPAASPSPSPSSNETEELRRKLAELEERFNDQKNNNRPLTLPAVPSGQTRQARIYSPRDGFLSIRSAPTLSTGRRVTTIAHGSTISVSDCQGETTADGRRGRWCRTSWNGYSGWVFDGFLVY